MTQCEHCGETSFYPAGPHMGRPCPLKKRESDARIAAVQQPAGPSGSRFFTSVPLELGDPVGIHTHIFEITDEFVRELAHALERYGLRRGHGLV